jgi:hypothetical protein
MVVFILFYISCGKMVMVNMWREITLVKVATIGAGTAYPSGAHEFTPGF